MNVNTTPSVAVEAADMSAVKERNDNSNPQQGSGGMRPERALPYSRPSIKIPPTQRDDRKLFVGGLPANVTCEEFRSFFEKFGPVMDSIVLVDRETNRSRGFGFVTFEDVDSTKKLLAMGHPEGEVPENPTVGRLEMMGKMIEVKTAEPKESSRRHVVDSTHQYGGNSQGRGRGFHFVSHPIQSAADHVVMSVPPASFDPYMYHQPYQSAPGAYVSGYMAPMYYCMPGHADVQQPMTHVMHSGRAAAGYGMETYSPAYAFVPSVPQFGMPSVIPPGHCQPYGALVQPGAVELQEDPSVQANDA